MVYCFRTATFITIRDCMQVNAVCSTAVQNTAVYRYTDTHTKALPYPAAIQIYPLLTYSLVRWSLYPSRKRNDRWRLCPAWSCESVVPSRPELSWRWWCEIYILRPVKVKPEGREGGSTEAHIRDTLRLEHANKRTHWESGPVCGAKDLCRSSSKCGSGSRW